MHRLLISGYYGFNNIGDESVLRTVTDALREGLEDIDITVLSASPEDTAEKYGVKAVARMKPLAIIRAVWNCDLLISGGGSLLQDATSRRSIHYYLLIIRLALLFGKKVFIYSQGIGPIRSRYNRRLTRRVLRHVHGIVVRDARSKRLLQDIGVPADRVYVTADPVIRVKKADLEPGRAILQAEGYKKQPGRLTVGWAIREKKTDSAFAHRIEECIRWLDEEYHADSILIPFYHSEDLPVAEVLQSRLAGTAVCIREKHLTDEMLSIIGNMDLLVGVRLHSLIYAAVMQVPMLGISYDPKIDSFLGSVGLTAMSDIEHFDLPGFQAAFRQALSSRDSRCATVDRSMTRLRKKLDTNERLISAILNDKAGLGSLTQSARS